MSLHDELRKIDPKKFDAAVQSLFNKGADNTDTMKKLVETYHDNYPELYRAVFHIYDSIVRQRPDIDPKEVNAARSGANLMMTVLSEYAQMEEVEARRQAKS